MKTKIITVTQRDIDNGNIIDPVYGRGGSCPVARAVCRAFKKSPKYVQVGQYTFSLNTWKTTKPLPGIAYVFVYDFDKGNPVRPFTFKLKY